MSVQPDPRAPIAYRYRWKALDWSSWTYITCGERARYAFLHGEAAEKWVIEPLFSEPPPAPTHYDVRVDSYSDSTARLPAHRVTPVVLP